MSTTVDIKIPALAESVTEGEIGTWLKPDGAVVKKGETVLELQTDKASLELAAEASGVVRHLKAEGDTVRVGEVVGRIETAAAPAKAAAGAPAPAAPPPAPPAPAKPAPPARQEERLAPSAPPPAASAPSPIAPAPAPRTPPAELAAPATPRVDEPGTRRERMSRLRRRIAERLVEAQHEAAILTTFNEVDMSAAQAVRAKHQEWFTRRHGVKLGFMSLFGRAIVHALRDVPALNAFIDGDDIVYHDHVHLGVAVQTDRGLVVPVVRDAHALGLGALEKEIARLASLARAGKIGLEDLQGATFTVSNGGVFGSLLSTPILTPPQSGILGMHSIKMRPICLDDGSIVARPMMYVALSYDHRIVDGREAVTFLVKVKERLEDPERALLDA